MNVYPPTIRLRFKVSRLFISERGTAFLSGSMAIGTKEARKYQDVTFIFSTNNFNGIDFNGYLPSQLVKDTVVTVEGDFSELKPESYQNKTTGETVNKLVLTSWGRNVLSLDAYDAGAKCFYPIEPEVPHSTPALDDMDSQQIPF